MIRDFYFSIWDAEDELGSVSYEKIEKMLYDIYGRHPKHYTMLPGSTEPVYTKDGITAGYRIFIDEDEILTKSSI